MKRFLLLLMLVAPFVSWAQTSPEDVARAFVKSAFRKDIERAKSVSHSSFHAFLDRMADAELVEGADTTDRTDYTSFKFIQMGKDGMVQYMDNGKERTMFVTREDGEWKVDPFGAAGDYDIGRFMLNVHSQHDVDMECVIEFEYLVGESVFKKTHHATVKPNQQWVNSFPANEVNWIRMNVHTEGATAAFTVFKAEKLRGADMMDFIQTVQVTSETPFEYRKQ